MFISSRKHIGTNLTVGVVLLLLVQFAVWVPSFAATTPIDFTGFDGSGFASSPAAGQLDSDIWRVTGMSDGDGTFGGTHTAGDFARGSDDGGVSTGGIYAFTNVGSSGNTILGVQPIGTDFTPGEITLKVQNTTGSTVANVYIAYKIWVYNDQNRANSLNFSYSTDDSNYTDIAALDFTSPEAADGSPTWASADRSTTITGINLANGSSIYLKWTGDDVSGSGFRDEYGIDDIQVRVGGPNAVTLSSMSALSASARPFSWPLAAVVALATLSLSGGLLWIRRRRLA